MIRRNFCLILFMFHLGNTFGQSYPNNEIGQYEDLLTPVYYNSSDGDVFRTEVNKFVHFARIIPFQHPLEDSLGQSPNYSIRRSFGDGIGPGNTGSHHPAFDYHVGNSETLVNLYAAHDGYVMVDKTVSRYRHYISITTEIKDSSGTAIGKMLTLYGHIDLDLDSNSNLNLDGKFVTKGDLISKHLYSGTLGGPHLHFEIRYYRNSDSGTEDFYGGQVGDKTSPSSGSWTYGFWNPDDGYGFAHPYNHLNSGITSVSENKISGSFEVYPNPTEGLISVQFDIQEVSKIVTVYSVTGQKIYHRKFTDKKNIDIDLTGHKRGVYLVNMCDNKQMITKKIVKE